MGIATISEASKKGEGLMAWWNKLMTHCKRGHAFTPENTYTTKRGQRHCRTCVRAFRSGRRTALPSEAQTRKLVEAAQAGLSLKNVTVGRHGKQLRPDLLVMPRYAFNALVVSQPKLGRRLIAQFKANAHNVISETATRRWDRDRTAPKLIRVDNVMDVISAAVPRHLARDHRDDVIQNIWLDVLQGRLKRSEIAVRAGSYIRAEYKNNHNAWGDRSLDVPIWLDSATTLLDTLSTEQGLWR